MQRQIQLPAFVSAPKTWSFRVSEWILEAASQTCQTKGLQPLVQGREPSLLALFNATVRCKQTYTYPSTPDTVLLL
eukprot:m.307016 g.307016  ORF g.307016 m.307016 type:complete len:76 (-) comp15930_c0_seq3:33-260(-)